MGRIEEALERARDTKALIIGEGAVGKTGEMFRQLFGNSTAIVVADLNTYKADAGVQREDKANKDFQSKIKQR